MSEISPDNCPQPRLVASCVDRKRLTPEPSRLLRHHGGPEQRRLDGWTAKLAETSGERLPARSLYKGDHWSVVLSVNDVDLWVASAGFGLVAADDRLCGYGATFAGGQADSVARPGEPTAEVGQRWWAGLSNWSGPTPDAPRSLDALASSAPDLPIVLAVSAAYAGALEHDLRAARESLADPGLLTIVSSGGLSPSLTDNLVQTDARLQAYVGGSLLSLNARVARALLERFGAEVLSQRSQEWIKEIASEQPARATFDRVAKDNDEIIAIVSEMLENEPALSASRALRCLRDQGIACEQRRFTELFRAEKERRVAV